MLQKASQAVPSMLSLLASARRQHRLKIKCPLRFYWCRDYSVSVFPIERGNDKAGRIIRALYFQFSVLFQPRFCPELVCCVPVSHGGAGARA